MTGQEKGDCLIEGTTWAGLTVLLFVNLLSSKQAIENHIGLWFMFAISYLIILFVFTEAEEKAKTVLAIVNAAVQNTTTPGWSLTILFKLTLNSECKKIYIIYELVNIDSVQETIGSNFISFNDWYMVF